MTVLYLACEWVEMGVTIRPQARQMYRVLFRLSSTGMKMVVAAKLADTPLSKS